MLDASSSEEAWAQVNFSDILSIMMHCAAHSLGYVVLGLTFVSIFLPSSLALGLFLDALKVAAKLLFKTIEASGSTRGSD